MKDIKIHETRKHSSSKDDVMLTAPASWNELTQQQLRYVLELIVLFRSDVVRIKTYCFIRLCGLKVHGRYSDGWKLSYLPKSAKERRAFFITQSQILSLLDKFSFVNSYETMDVRLESICGLHAVDTHLHGVAFIDYLNAEKAYQGYLISKQDAALVNLLKILYRQPSRHKEKISPDKTDLLSVFLWYGFVIKRTFRNAFPNLFRPATSSDSEDFDIVASINAQIRALTEGDITKEDKVMKMDCWRALTELDAKAREAREMKRMMDKHKVH